MTYDITRVMRGGDVYSGDEIRATNDKRALAIAKFREWGAIFRFSASNDGEWFSDVIITKRRSAEWVELSSGGFRGSGWPTPWSPPLDGWEGEPLRIMGTLGETVFDDDDNELDLTVVTGFVIPQVDAIETDFGGTSRITTITSSVGAFALVGLSSTVTVTCLAADGSPLSTPRLIRPQ